MRSLFLAAVCSLSCLFWAGCVSVGSESERYAELWVAADGTTQLHICSDVWMGVFTIHGYGGHRQNVFYWTTLSGDGPEYKDPLLHKNSPSPDREHKGSIIVDKKRMLVIVNLERIIPTTTPVDKFEPDAKSGPSSANGTYPLKIKRATEPWQIMSPL